MSTPQNLAAWQPEAKADLEIKEAPYYEVKGDEILIKNEAIAIQPFDARVRHDAYIKVPYPFILGSTVAGTIVAAGPDVGELEVGDRVVCDTPVYKTHLTKNGGWQRYVVGNASSTALIGDTSFEEAITIPFPLQTAVGALHFYLGMELPGPRAEAAKEERVLIWGGGGAVGGYAVQYAKSVGYTVIATASPASKKHLQALGASAVLDYNSEHVINDVRKLGPYAFMFTTSGDPQSQKWLGLLLQPEGGTFASTLAGDVELPSNVKRVYEKFSMITQSDEPKNREFARWWYGNYLGKAIRERIVQPSPLEKRQGGLKVVQRAADDVVEGRTRAKLVINPQEG